ncbi:MAG: choline dehydrogenase [Gammaproteobacteria bacterium]|nr:choline dehydrogenase [Gammaproteobacteria bacterium]
MNFDYIIIGAGSAGCVLANRLSENPDHSVLLLEAGGRDISPMIHIPAGWAANFNNPKVDWGYNTEPEPHLKNRQIYWPRGKVLGGSSSINGMIYIRGVPYDYDQWAQKGNSGWSWSEVLPYFRRSEDQQHGETTLHGKGGRLRVEDVRMDMPLQQAFVDAAVEAGLPRNNDFNGETQEGAGYYQFTQKNGRRWSTSVGYLNDIKKRKNLRIVTGALTSRIHLEDKVARQITYKRGDKEETVTANREILLCGGAVNSPQLLELSGIGSPEILARAGIEVRHALPGVGENLQDHLYSKFVYMCTLPATINMDVQGIRLIPTVLKYLFFRRGPLTFGSAPVGAFAYTRNDIEAPDIQIHFASGATNFQPGKKGIEAMKFHAMTGVVNQSRPESRGHIHIRSANPGEHPEILANYLDHETDRETLVKGMRLLQQIFESPSLDAYRGNRLMPGEHVVTDSDLLDYIREDATTVFHPVGTCKMGSDTMAVVNDKLQVQGLRNLRIVDASIMPTLVSGNTNAAVIMVAEKAADMILGKTSQI